MPDLPELDQRLNSFNPELRAAALDAAAAKLSSPNPEGYQEPPPPRGEGSQVFNLHCHSFFSYNGYGYSPSALAVIAGMYNWRAVGLVDFDVLDGVDEFLAATRKLNIRAVAGMETRVFIPELADVEINSPGEPGIAYHLGVGFLSTAVPEKERAFAAELRKKAADRTRTVVKRVNEFLPEIALDFDAVARRFTPNGNVTERHVCAAYREAAEKRFSESELVAYWTEKIGSFDPDPVKLEASIRSRLMKKGGPGYVTPTPESFPTLAEMNDFIRGCGAVPVPAWLNGLSAGESDPGALLDLHLRYGARGVTLIPDRNWRAADATKAARLTAALDRFVAAAEARALSLLAGTEMNAPGQLLADDFTVPALAKHLKTFIAGADAFTR